MSAVNKEVAIEVIGLSKEFVLPQSKTTSLKQAALNIVRENKVTTQKVLNDINFTVNKGDFFGIVGRNGSGKSTLLKLLSGIYTPGEGIININGSLVPFIELGVGFNPELSGRDNVYLNGALLGYTHKQMDGMYEEVVDFAELGPFMDQKLKNYSSGMQVRLAFSIAIRAKADILVLDEVLAVGDEAFQRKCNDYFDKIKKDKDQTVILVTHSMEAVKKYCNKAILIKDGKIIDRGNPVDIANSYSTENIKANVQSQNKSSAPKYIKDLHVVMNSPPNISQRKTLDIDIMYTSTVSEKTCVVVEIRDMDKNIPVAVSGSKLIVDSNVKVNWKINLDEVNNFNGSVAVSIRDENNRLLGYLTQSDAPTIIYRRSDYSRTKRETSYAVLFNTGDWII